MREILVILTDRLYYVQNGTLTGQGFQITFKQVPDADVDAGALQYSDYCMDAMHVVQTHCMDAMHVVQTHCMDAMHVVQTHCMDAMHVVQTHCVLVYICTNYKVQ